MANKTNKETSSSPLNAIFHAILGIYGIIGVALSTLAIFKVPFAESNAKDYWRHALAAIILIIALIAGVISFAIYIFNANYFKGEIVEYVKTNNQRNLILDGDIKITFFPKLGFDAGKMIISQRNSPKTFASIEDAHFYIAWWPLFLKQLKIESVVLNGVHANINRYKDGTTNLDELFVSNANMGNIKFEIDNIKLSKSSFNVQDDASDYSFSVHDMTLETGKLADTTPSDIAANFRLESKKPLIDSKVAFTSHLTYDLKNRLIDLANFDAQIQGNIGGIDNLTLNLQGTLHNNQTQHKTTLDKFVVNIKGKLENRKLDANLLIPKLKLENKILSGGSLQFNTTLLQEEENITASFEMPAFEIAEDKFKTDNISASFDIFKSGRTLQGKLSSPLNIALDTQTLELPDLNSNFTATHPLLAQKISAKLTGNMQANITEQKINLSLNAKMDDSNFIGKIGMQNFTQPEYTIDLGVNTLELDRYLASDWNKHWQNVTLPFNFSSFKNLKLQGKFRSNHLTFAKLKLNNLYAEIQAANDNVHIEPLNMQLYDGNVSGSLNILAQDTPTFTLKQKLKGVQINDLLVDFTQQEAQISGKGNINIDLNGSGTNIAELRKSLQGKARVTLEHGSIAGINLNNTLLENIKQMGVKDAKLIAPAKFTEASEFSVLKANAEINEGQLHSKDFQLKTPLFISKGTAESELTSGQMDYRLNILMAVNLKQKSHGEIAELKGMNIPMQISGNISAPLFTLDVGSATGGSLNKDVKLKTVKTTTAPIATKSKIIK